MMSKNGTLTGEPVRDAAAKVVQTIVFEKPWSQVEGNELIHYPQGCTATVGIYRNQIQKAMACRLLNSHICSVV